MAVSTQAVLALLGAGFAAPQVARAIAPRRSAIRSRLKPVLNATGAGAVLSDPARNSGISIPQLICQELELTPEECSAIVDALGGDFDKLENLAAGGLATACAEADDGSKEGKALGIACGLFSKMWLGGLIDIVQGNLGAPTWKAPYSPFGDDTPGAYWTRSNLLLAGDNASDVKAATEAMKYAERTWPQARAFCWYPVPSGLTRRIRGDSPALVWPAASWVWKSRGFKSPQLVTDKGTYYPAGLTKFNVGNVPRAGQATGQLCWSVSKQSFVDTPGSGSRSPKLSLLFRPGHHLVD